MVYIKGDFKFDQIVVSKLFENRVSFLFNLKHLYPIEDEFYEDILHKYLPVDSSLVTQESLSEAMNKFIDFMLYKIIDHTRDYLATDNKLY